MQDFRKLRVWQAAREITVLVYRATANFPPTERYGLAAQMRSAVTSIGANIAESAGRGTRADTNRCFQIAFASACELLNHLITALALGYLTTGQFDELEARLEPLRKMLASLMARLRKASPAP